MNVISYANDTLDAVMWRHLGTTDGIEEVLAINPNLSRFKAVIPLGTLVELPEAPPKKYLKTINLWS